MVNFYDCLIQHFLNSVENADTFLSILVLNIMIKDNIFRFNQLILFLQNIKVRQRTDLIVED